tara:strand:- start:4408 stop:4830 length:423 start_codon:yes stop_codon:yes gene_type:complete
MTFDISKAADATEKADMTVKGNIDYILNSCFGMPSDQSKDAAEFICKEVFADGEATIQPDGFDCDFYYFKPSGKWYSQGAGNFPKPITEGGYYVVDHAAIMRENETMPGMMGSCLSYTIIIVPRPHCKVETGYPRLLKGS